MNPFLKSIDVLKVMIRWKWHLLVVVLISVAASAILSGPTFIQPKFKSFALLYPSNLIAYSTESATEQMLQMLQSSDVRKQIINDFSLLKHYEIDSTKNKHYLTTVLKMYEENVKINKTEYESVEIEVWDTDPEIAARMVDSIVRFGDMKIRALQRQKSSEVLVIAQNQLDRQKNEMDSMENALKNYSLKYGLIDYKIQTKEFSRGYLNALTAL